MIDYAERFRERPAKVVPNEQFGSKPWFACALRRVPHDAHVDNGGNIHCPGRAGTLLSDTFAAQERLRRVEEIWEQSQRTIERAQQAAQRARDEITSLSVFLSEEDAK